MKQLAIILSLTLTVLTIIMQPAHSAQRLSASPVSSDSCVSQIATRPGTGLGFTCSGLRCTCSGDDDCNDMFSTGLCGDVAQCYEDSNGGVRCECLRLK